MGKEGETPVAEIAEEGEPRILYVACDRSEDERQLCAQIGMEKLPTLVVGGEGLVGFQSIVTLTSFVEERRSLADELHKRHAALYGTSRCPWTGRQRIVLGPFSEHAFQYVPCDEEPSRCAHVTGVPTIELDHGGVWGKQSIVGFRTAKDLKKELGLA
jgi:hypothetical protein